MLNQKAKRMCKEWDASFPKELVDPKQHKNLVLLTPLVTFKNLMDNVDKMQVLCDILLKDMHTRDVCMYTHVCICTCIHSVY